MIELLKDGDWMQLVKVDICNFKGITHVTLPFEPEFNLIIGDNGSGKTSILDAISVSLGAFTAGIEGAYGKHFTKEEVRMETKVLGDATYNLKPQTPVTVTTTATINGNAMTWTRRKSSLHASRSTIEPRDITKLASERSMDDDAVLPIINYQGASRMWTEKRNKSKDVFQGMSRYLGYLDSLSPESSNKLLLNWCRAMEQISWQEDKKIAEYEAVKNAVATFMSVINGKSVTRVFYDKKREALMYKEEQEVLPISYLSSGYQSLVWMVFDIAYRMALLNPNLRERVVMATPGVVLIDELDVHLHPKWQWHIIEALKQTFPHVQFIATTHSPIILASCKNQVLRIEGDNVYPQSLTYGVPIDDVLEAYQDSPDMPRHVQDKLQQLYDATLVANFEAAKQLLQALEDELGSDNPLVVRARLNLDFEMMDISEV